MNEGTNSQRVILIACGFGTATTWEMRSAKIERDMLRRVNIMLVAAGTVTLNHSALNTKTRPSARVTLNGSQRIVLSQLHRPPGTNSTQSSETRQCKHIATETWNGTLTYRYGVRRRQQTFCFGNVPHL